MAEARRSTLGIAVLATAASLGLHAALLSLALRRAGPAVEAPPRMPLMLSLAGPAMERVTAAEAPPAQAPSVPAPPAPAPLESFPADAPAALPPARLADVQPAVAEPPPPFVDPTHETPSPASLAPLPTPSAPVEASAVEPPAPAIEAAPEMPRLEAVRPPPPPDIVAPLGETPPATDAAPPRSLAEAVPPASLGSPGPSASAATPAVELPTLTTQAVSEALQAEIPGQPSPPVATMPLSETPPLAVAAPPRLLAEATVTGGTPRASPPAAVSSVAPPDVTEVRAPDATVAAREAPAVSDERVRGFVDRYDGGPCFFAAVAGATPAGVDIEAFSPTIDQVVAFHSAFMGQLGVEPDVVGQRVWKEQCFAVEFLRRTRIDGADPVTLRLDRREARGGDVLSGELRGAGARRVEVALVSEAGVVTEVSDSARRADGATTFAIPLPPGQPGGPYPEIVIATVDAAPPRPGLSLAAALSSARPVALSPTMRSAAELILVRR